LSDKLQKATGIPVELFDERLSSADADWKLAEMELTKDQKKQRQDAVAAASFLQAFLEHRKEVIVTPKIIKSNSPLEAARGVLLLLKDKSLEAIAQRGICNIVISGGRGPMLFFELLAMETSLDWSKIHIFWADERCVEPTHNDSNFGLAHRVFLSKVAIPAENIHRIAGENPAYQAAEEYAQQIRRHFGILPGQWPAFDVVVLGLGADGHTASLLPGTEILENQNDIAAQVYSEAVLHTRVSLTIPVLTAARSLIFLITGKEKAEIVSEVLTPPLRPWQYPIQSLWPAVGKMTWFIDEQASGLLKSEPVI
jgi:6-phosphogluconolactonase